MNIPYKLPQSYAIKITKAEINLYIVLDEEPVKKIKSCFKTEL